jgi:hypothetical protein
VDTTNYIADWPRNAAHLMRMETTADFPQLGERVGVARWTYYVTFRGQAALE